MRKRDHVLNVVKSGAKRTRKVFQKVQPVLNKAKLIISPRNTLSGFILMPFQKPSMALAAPSPVPEVTVYLVGLEGFKCIMSSAACTGYVIGAHRAAPHDPILKATKAATSPFEVANEAMKLA